MFLGSFIVKLISSLVADELRSSQWSYAFLFMSDNVNWLEGGTNISNLLTVGLPFALIWKVQTKRNIFLGDSVSVLISPLPGPSWFLLFCEHAGILYHTDF